MVVSLVEKKQEVEEERSVSMFKHSFCFSGNITDNPVYIEKEVLFFSKVHESDKSDHIMKQSEEGTDSIFEDGKKMFGDSIAESQKPVEMISSTGKCGKCSDNFLGMEETRPLIESELGSILEAQRTGLEDIGSKSPGESMEQTDQKHGSLEFKAGNADNSLNNLYGCTKCASEVEDMQGMVGSDSDKMKGFNGIVNLVENSLQNAVEYEIPVMVGASIGGCGQVNVKKDGKEGKRDKFPQRWAKRTNKVSDANGKQNMLSLVSEAQNVCLKRGDGSKISYSRKELEELRFVNVEAQRIMWNEVCHGLGSFVAQELKGMADSQRQKQGNRNVEHHQGIVKRKENFAVFSVMAAKGRGNHCLQVYSNLKNG
ncbi:uncharacterized protein LOC122670964 [Telopea speciosissima]|uniref:uncharacterized protein LOC122670964 n=1 Tax=Telopea speciosissima TaxID=54955 RepID=UPI001CC657B7|nr:uncharacterized protein LOC122670964 [Telopea speciosissima]